MARIVFALLAVVLVAWVLPKVRLRLTSPGITNNNWNGYIDYRSADGRYVAACDFMGHDSLPYWEGQNSWEDEQVCSKLPRYLHQGLPPHVMRVTIGGRITELRAPLLWGRLF